MEPTRFKLLCEQQHLTFDKYPDSPIYKLKLQIDGNDLLVAYNDETEIKGINTYNVNYYISNFLKEIFENDTGIEEIDYENKNTDNTYILIPDVTSLKVLTIRGKAGTQGRSGGLKVLNFKGNVFLKDKTDEESEVDGFSINTLINNLMFINDQLETINIDKLVIGNYKDTHIFLHFININNNKFIINIEEVCYHSKESCYLSEIQVCYLPEKIVTYYSPLDYFKDMIVNKNIKSGVVVNIESPLIKCAHKLN